MNRFHQVARKILDRCPDPAMTLADFLAELERDHPEHRADEAAILRSLDRCDGIRVLRRPPSADAAEVGPVAWLLSHWRISDRPFDPSLPARRIRATVLALGRVAETRSLAGWARWNHLVMGAAQARASFDRASRDRAVGSGSTSDAPRTSRRWVDPRSPAVRTR